MSDINPISARSTAEIIDRLRTRLERAEAALKGLIDAVAYDMRHGDDADEVTAWTSLKILANAMTVVSAYFAQGNKEED